MVSYKNMPKIKSNFLSFYLHLGNYFGNKRNHNWFLRLQDNLILWLRNEPNGVEDLIFILSLSRSFFYTKSSQWIFFIKDHKPHITKNWYPSCFCFKRLTNSTQSQIHCFLFLFMLFISTTLLMVEISFPNHVCNKRSNCTIK